MSVRDGCSRRAEISAGWTHDLLLLPDRLSQARSGARHPGRLPGVIDVPAVTMGHSTGYDRSLARGKGESAGELLRAHADEAQLAVTGILAVVEEGHEQLEGRRAQGFLARPRLAARSRARE